MQLEDVCVKEIKSDIHSIKAILVSRSVSNGPLHMQLFVFHSACPPSFATKTLGDLEEDGGDSGAGESPAGESVGTEEAEDGTEAEEGTEADDETEADGETVGTESQDTDENGSWSGLEDQEELPKNDNEEINKTARKVEDEMGNKGMEEEKKEEDAEDLKEEEAMEERKNQERELSFVDGQWIEE